MIIFNTINFMSRQVQVMVKQMSFVVFSLLGLVQCRQAEQPVKQYPGWKLVWHDEFDRDGHLNEDWWMYENGFVRNKELQWYQPENAFCEDGLLVIEARKERKTNIAYDEHSENWRFNRPFAEYTSSCVKTRMKKEFLYGRFEIRAKIPTRSGAWPAIWTLGADLEWPSCGEIDLMEYYRIGGVPHILANVAWGKDRRWDSEWRTGKTPYDYFLQKDPQWGEKFHVWRMDWDEEAVRLYLDDELLNEVFLSETVNGDFGQHRNPFRQPHYLLLNLAIGVSGGIPDEQAFPMRYEIDYVRVYQKTGE